MDLVFGSFAEVASRIRVVVPYRTLREETVLALAAQGPVDVEYREVDEFYDYYRLLCELWERGKSFIMVEHDILPWPGALAELWGCGTWCCMPYNLGGSNLIAAHGCTKFGADVLEVTRERVLAIEGDERHWTRLDTVVNEILEAVGLIRHVHDTPVLHLNRRVEDEYRHAHDLPPLHEVTPLRPHAS